MAVANQAVEVISVAALPTFVVLLVGMIAARAALSRAHGRAKTVLSRMVEDVGDVSISRTA